MGVKAVDIARELGLSKATVSLALNDKPGVKAGTKKLILECRDRLESEARGYGTHVASGGKGDTIKLVIMNCNYRIAIEAEMDLWTDEKAVFNRIAKGWGCRLDIIYFDVGKEDINDLAEQCNREDVMGVIIEGTEITEKECRMFNRIKKPLVLYDVDDTDNKYTAVMMDNRGGINSAMECLVSKGYKDIVYLEMDKDIYNFQSRRNAFTEYMLSHNLCSNPMDHMFRMGGTIAEAYRRIGNYLDKYPLPDAFIAESYHLSIAAIRLFKERGIKMPDDVAFIGVDELPEFLTDGYTLSTVKIPLTERAKLTMIILKHEIEDACDMKTKLYTSCRFIEGNTV